MAERKVAATLIADLDLMMKQKEKEKCVLR